MSKKCSKKSPEEQQERIDINRLYNLCRYSNLSKNNKKMLNEFLKDPREAVRKAAEEIEELFYPKYDEPEPRSLLSVQRLIMKAWDQIEDRCYWAELQDRGM